MKYSVAATLAALVAYVQAKAEFTNTQADFAAISAGKDFTLTWSGAEGPVTILLKTGPSDDLTTVQTITSKPPSFLAIHDDDANLPSSWPVR